MGACGRCALVAVVLAACSGEMPVDEPDGSSDMRAMPGCEIVGMVPDAFVYARCFEADGTVSRMVPTCDESGALEEIRPLLDAPFCWQGLDGIWQPSCKEPGFGGQEIWGEPSYLYCVPGS